MPNGPQPLPRTRACYELPLSKELYPNYTNDRLVSTLAIKRDEKWMERFAPGDLFGCSPRGRSRQPGCPRAAIAYGISSKVV